jgi:hypothetical protein
LKVSDPRALVELASWRDAIGKANFRRRPYERFGLSFASRGYLSVAAKLAEGDPRAGEELTALSNAIWKTRDAEQLAALALAYSAVAKAVPSRAEAERDIAVLLDKMSALRTSAQCEAFAGAIKEAVRLASQRLSWEKTGFVYVAALLFVSDPSRLRLYRLGGEGRIG